MNFTARTKSELCRKKYESGCCLLAGLSAFVRTAGSIISEREVYGFSVNGQADCVKYFAKVISELFSGKVEFNYSSGGDKVIGFTFLNESSADVLIQLGIFRFVNGELAIALEPDEYITENDCCKRAFAAGAFMGAGSITVPECDEGASATTGYHLEFCFSKYLTALRFSEMLAEQGFLPKIIERKQSYVVYFKQNEEIKDMLAYMGADASVLAFSDIVIMRETKNRVNRETNCELHNVSRQVDASVKICSAIKSVDEAIGLSNLPEELASVAAARVKYSDMTLTELADKLGIGKSCLNHRLRKIASIAKEL